MVLVACPGRGLRLTRAPGRAGRGATPGSFGRALGFGVTASWFSGSAASEVSSLVDGEAVEGLPRLRLMLSLLNVGRSTGELAAEPEDGAGVAEPGVVPEIFRLPVPRNRLRVPFGFSASLGAAFSF